MSDVSRDIEMMAYKIRKVAEELKKEIKEEGIVGDELDNALQHLEDAQAELDEWADAKKYEYIDPMKLPSKR
jgi:HPt (histidine-containing phosphotransfer) domain-containing protein